MVSYFVNLTVMAVIREKKLLRINKSRRKTECAYLVRFSNLKKRDNKTCQQVRQVRIL